MFQRLKSKPGASDDCHADGSNIRHTPSELYPKFLGDSWRDLDYAMRRLHGSGAVVRAVGAFQVRQGGNRLARAIARLARLPAAGEAVDVRLQVTALEEGE